MYSGTGRFVCYDPQSFRHDVQVEIDIIAADGEPHQQTIRLNSLKSKQPKRSAGIGEEGNDLVDVLGKLIDNCSVLWIGLAWPKGTTGSRPVQVTLRESDGNAFSNRRDDHTVIGFNPEGAAEKMTMLLSQLEGRQFR